MFVICLLLLSSGPENKKPWCRSSETSSWFMWVQSRPLMARSWSSLRMPASSAGESLGRSRRRACQEGGGGGREGKAHE